MQTILFLLALLALSACQANLLLSHPHTTTIVKPPNTLIGYSAHHSSKYADWLGNGAEWVSNSEQVSLPAGYSATYQSLFRADCLSTGTLRIAVDDIFRVWVNGVYVGTGNDINRVYLYNITLLCGVNNLTIEVDNSFHDTPSAVVFTVIQDQTQCYNCVTASGLEGHYNRQTCQCECVSRCGCQNPLRWYDYPSCHCACDSFADCVAPLYFDNRVCECKCPAKECPLGSSQDPNTCECVGTCAAFSPCPSGQEWDRLLCRCMRTNVPCEVFTTCLVGQAPDPLTCQCVPTGQCTLFCEGVKVVDTQSCSCVCPSRFRNQCQAPNRFREDTCQC